MTTRTVSWGDALAVEMFKTPGGMKHVVDSINRVMGPHYGTRNTFARLVRVEDPGKLNPKDQWRAWLLLTALGHEPAEWSLEAQPPPYMDAWKLRQQLMDAVSGPEQGPETDPWATRLPHLDSNQEPAD